MKCPITPHLSEAGNYADWNKAVAIWSPFISRPATKQGPPIFLPPQGSACDAVLELSQNAISFETGLNQVLTRLDDLCLKDETLQKYEAFEAFNSFRQSSHVSIYISLVGFQISLKVMAPWYQMIFYHLSY